MFHTYLHDATSQQAIFIFTPGKTGSAIKDTWETCFFLKYCMVSLRPAQGLQPVYHRLLMTEEMQRSPVLRIHLISVSEGEIEDQGCTFRIGLLLEVRRRKQKYE